MGELFTIVCAALPFVFFAYTLSGNWISIHKTLHGTPPNPVFNSIWKWTKWPSFVHLFLNPAWDFTHDEIHWYSSIFYVINVLIWWALRNAGDDDLTKKLKKKLKEKIDVIAGRLVIVQAPA